MNKKQRALRAYAQNWKAYHEGRITPETWRRRFARTLNAAEKAGATEAEIACAGDPRYDPRYTGTCTMVEKFSRRKRR